MKFGRTKSTYAWRRRARDAKRQQYHLATPKQPDRRERRPPRPGQAIEILWRRER